MSNNNTNRNQPQPRIMTQGLVRPNPEKVENLIQELSNEYLAEGANGPPIVALPFEGRFTEAVEIDITAQIEVIAVANSTSN